MICRKCNGEIPDDSKFCIKCGCKIDATEEIKKKEIHVGQKELIIAALFLCMVLIIGILFGKSSNKKKDSDSIAKENNVRNEYIEEFSDFEINEDDEIFEGLLKFNSSDQEKGSSELYFPGLDSRLSEGSIYTNFTRQFCDVTVYMGMDFKEFEEAINNSEMGFVMYGDKDYYYNHYGDPITSSTLTSSTSAYIVYIYKNDEYIFDAVFLPYTDAPEVMSYADTFLFKISVKESDDDSTYSLMGYPGNISKDTWKDWTSTEAIDYLKSISKLRFDNGATIETKGGGGDSHIGINVSGGEDKSSRGFTYMTLVSVNGELIPFGGHVTALVSTDNKFIGLHEFYDRATPEFGSMDDDNSKNINIAKNYLEAAGYTLDDIYKIDNPRIKFR